MSQDKMRLKVISCGVLYREICYCAAISKNIIDLSVLPQGLHDHGGDRMRVEIQKEIDKVEEGVFDAILLGYGLCNNGICDLVSNTKMVVPRAHDCITLLLGSKERYQEVFKKNPGTYYSSCGWLERGVIDDSNMDTFSQYGTAEKYNELVKKYGEEKAQYIKEMLGDWYKNYKDYLFIDTKVCNHPEIRAAAKVSANDRGLEYKEIDGTTSLILKMFDGQWDNEDFLIVPEKTPIKASYDEYVMTV